MFEKKQTFLNSDLIRHVYFNYFYKSVGVDFLNLHYRYFSHDLYFAGYCTVVCAVVQLKRQNLVARLHSRLYKLIRTFKMLPFRYIIESEDPLKSIEMHIEIHVFT